MGFLRKLKQIFTITPQSPFLEIKVRCNRCKEIIYGQIHLHNDLSPGHEGGDAYYYCRKGLVGSGENRCFQQVVVEYTFDGNRNVIDRQITGGQFVDEGA